MYSQIKRREFLAGASATALASFGLGSCRRGSLLLPTELSDLTAVQAVRLMRQGDISVEAYSRELLRQAERTQHLNIFRSIDPELLLEAARAADLHRASGATPGALHGLPIPVKDSINTRALPTSYGTRGLKSFTPTDDAAVLKPLFVQGALLMGKTNLHELSFGWTSDDNVFGPVRNPHHADHVAGGSSGGSAAAVAANIAPLTIGEDTLGSIRVPASMCGIAGLRPSYGRYPAAGVMPLSAQTFDQVGPLARSVADIALFDEVLTGNTTPLSIVKLQNVRLGVPKKGFFSCLDNEVEKITWDTLRRLESDGVTLVYDDAPDLIRETLQIAFTIVGYEALPSMTRFLNKNNTGISFTDLIDNADQSIRDAFKASMLPPNRPSQESYETAQLKRRKLRQLITGYFREQEIDAMAFPPILIPPPLIGTSTDVAIPGCTVSFAQAMARNVSLASCTGMCSLVLPAGKTSRGLPVGVEFAALHGSDRELLSIGTALETTLGTLPIQQTG